GYAGEQRRARVGRVDVEVPALLLVDDVLAEAHPAQEGGAADPGGIGGLLHRQAHRSRLSKQSHDCRGEERGAATPTRLTAGGGVRGAADLCHGRGPYGPPRLPSRAHGTSGTGPTRARYQSIPLASRARRRRGRKKPPAREGRRLVVGEGRRPVASSPRP